jgi:hypothetical protein
MFSGIKVHARAVFVNICARPIFLLNMGRMKLARERLRCVISTCLLRSQLKAVQHDVLARTLESFSVPLKANLGICDGLIFRVKMNHIKIVRSPKATSSDRSFFFLFSCKEVSQTISLDLPGLELIEQN